MKKRVLLTGGLGNQMFQYAFYLSLKNRGISCCIDASYYSVVKMHNGFELRRVFEIQEQTSVHTFHGNIIRILRKYTPKFLVYKDRVYQYCEEAYTAKQPVLMGDWLSYRYFDTIKSQIYNAYCFKGISPQNVSVANEIHKKNAVSIHIRRGDYLRLPNYCVCDEYYYGKAIELIKDKVENSIFYVFSNEPEWCNSFMKNFNVSYKIIDWNQGKDSYQDMYLMTQCKHNIIANSTFSWWGAWLNQNQNKIVVAPSQWFRNNDKNINCPGWALIDTSKQNGK